MCTFFWRRDLPTFFFLAHEYFMRFVCVLCFPRPSFKFRSEIFIRRAISEFMPPTTSPPSVSPLAPRPNGISNRRCHNHSFNHIYVLLRSSQVSNRSLSRPWPDCLNDACETSSCLQIPTAPTSRASLRKPNHISCGGRAVDGGQWRDGRCAC